jgi:tartrate dehydratase beta subunit/fumarate hydratase class I family protein
MAGLGKGLGRKGLSKEREWERMMSGAGSMVPGCRAAFQKPEKRGVSVKLGKELSKERAREQKRMTSCVKVMAQGGCAALRNLEVRGMRAEKNWMGLGKKELSKEQARERERVGSGVDLAAQGGCVVSVVRKLEGRGLRVEELWK